MKAASTQMLKRLGIRRCARAWSTISRKGFPAGTTTTPRWAATGAAFRSCRVSNPDYRKYVGKRVSEMIADKKKPWLDVLFQALIDNHGAIPALYYHHNEEDMRYALKKPFVSIGTDGSAMNARRWDAAIPHPRSFGTFARLMGDYVRDEKLLTLEDAVRKMTSANAARFASMTAESCGPGCGRM